MGHAQRKNSLELFFLLDYHFRTYIGQQVLKCYLCVGYIDRFFSIIHIYHVVCRPCIGFNAIKIVSTLVKIKYLICALSCVCAIFDELSALRVFCPALAAGGCTPTTRRKGCSRVSGALQTSALPAGWWRWQAANLSSPPPLLSCLGRVFCTCSPRRKCVSIIHLNFACTLAARNRRCRWARRRE